MWWKRVEPESNQEALNAVGGVQSKRTLMASAALGALLLLTACTFVVQPEGATGEATSAPEGETASSSAVNTTAEFVLPDGTSCLFSGTGATVVFDDKRASYTCEPIISTLSTSETMAILDEPVIIGPTEYAVDLAVIGHTDEGFQLHSSQVVSFTAWQIELEDGRVCLHAGFGATMGFDDKRLNYTCDKGDSTADEVGLMGELMNQGNGVWLAQIDEIGRDSSGFTQLSSTQLPVVQISGVDIMANGDAEAGESAESEAEVELVGPVWQWVQTQYGDGSLLISTNPSGYTLRFYERDIVEAQLDCNSASGSYTVDGSSLTFGPMASTMMACPEGSQAGEFSQDLAEVYSYVIEDGHLYLSMKLDTGIMEFAPQ